MSQGSTSCPNVGSAFEDEADSSRRPPGVKGSNLRVYSRVWAEASVGGEVAVGLVDGVFRSVRIKIRETSS